MKIVSINEFALRVLFNQLIVTMNNIGMPVQECLAKRIAFLPNIFGNSFVCLASTDWGKNRLMCRLGETFYTFLKEFNSSWKLI